MPRLPTRGGTIRFALLRLALLVFLVAPSAWAQGVGPALTHGPILGAVTDNSIRIWGRADVAASMDVVVEQVGVPGTVQASTALAASSDFTGTVELLGLEPGSDYGYRVLLDAQQVFEGSFRTLPLQDTPSSFSFAFASDVHANFAPFTTFDALAATGPDFLILGGDNIYADSFVVVENTQAGYEERYRQTWVDPSFRAALWAIPTFMIWDDHELFGDWYPGLDTRYSNARAAFDEYQGSHNPDRLLQVRSTSASRPARWISSCSTRAHTAVRTMKSTGHPSPCSA